MKTCPERYAIRHRQIIERAEREFIERRKTNRKLTIPKAIKVYALAVHKAIESRDELAGPLATAAAHLAMKVDIDFVQSGD
jgi:hypothetical protein